MKKQLPAFANETEEANWWYDNREKHAEEFEQAFLEGRVRRGGIAQRMAAAKEATTVTIATKDAMAAVALAEKKGVAVQTYLSELVHKALEQELQRAG